MNIKKIIILSSLMGIIFFSFLFIIGEKTIYFDLYGKDIININIGEEYKEEGYKALYCTKNFKLFCKNITNKVIVKRNKNHGFYKEYINYILKYKNHEKVYIREINYRDLESPNIELVQNNSSICPNGEYIEEGYKAYDNVDGDITDKVIVKRIDNIIYYTVTDSANNKKVVYRTINYSDNDTPVITLNGAKKAYVFINQEYKEKGYYANDNCDGDLTSNVKISNNINTSKTGIYKIDYSVQDSMGNKTTISREIEVYDDLSKIPKNGKIVYLTFDDGPCSYTEDIIKILNKYNVKATFFVTNQFSSYQNIIKKEFNSGHSIAVHTYSHNYNQIYGSLDNYISDFNQMNEIIHEQTGTYSKIFRFPGGSSNTVSRKYKKGVVTEIAASMQESGYVYFDWNVGSGDAGGTTSSDQVYKNVVNGLKASNSVVLQHDIKGFSVNAVEKIIKYGLNNGYSFQRLEVDSPAIRHSINN